MVCLWGLSTLANRFEAGWRDDWTVIQGLEMNGQASSIVIVGPLLGFRCGPERQPDGNPAVEFLVRGRIRF
jgi:hypothetical protein